MAPRLYDGECLYAHHYGGTISREVSVAFKGFVDYEVAKCAEILGQGVCCHISS